MTDQSIRALDELWTLQDGNDVLQFMRHFRETLLRNEVDIEDASEAFLAIQGAALRFHPSQQKHQQGNTMRDDNHKLDDATTRLCWYVTEEALWATAALSCVCVGPAWRSQIQHRRLMIAENKARREFEHSIPSARSPNTATNGSISAVRSNTYIVTEGNDPSLPSVPEVLPAAMLRFASSVIPRFPNMSTLSSLGPDEIRLWQERKRNIAVGQRKLVLALCCQSPEIRKDFGDPMTSDEHRSSRMSPKGPKGTEWTIPGANELVGDMLMFWLSLIDSSSLSNDWWYTLQVTKATTDLVSTGWRILPKQNTGHLLINHLLGIAEKGISLLDTRSAIEKGIVTSEIRPKEERLAASASAAEAISALTSLWSRGLIPLDSQQMASRKIFRLHVISGLIKASMLDIFPLGVRQSAPKEQTEDSSSASKILLAQIESCIADTADFLWILFATKSSSANAIHLFLEIMNTANPNSPSCSLFASNDWDAEKKLVCMEAGTAIRMISTALWRRGPMVSPDLRAYMGTVLGIIRDIAASIHSRIHERLNAKDFLAHVTCDMLTLALDTVVALGNFADRQLVSGIDHVSGTEWDIFLLAVEEAFIPWHQYSQRKTDLVSSTDESEIVDIVANILDRAHLECESLLLRLGACLDKFVTAEGSPFHSVVSYESKRRLFLFILRTAIVRMEPTDAELLGLSVFPAWVKFGQWPFKLEESVSEILLEGFSKFEDGSYVHAPQVRLAALRSLGRNVEHEGTKVSNSENGTIDDSMPSDGSRVSLTTIFSTALDRNESLADITSIVIPILQSILLENSPEPLGQRVITLSKDTYGGLGRRNGSESIRTASSLSNDSPYSLESFAVKLVGRLVRHNACNNETRVLLVDLLSSIGLDARRNRYRCDEEDVVVEDTLRSRVHLQSSVRLAAIGELHSCLIAPFGDHPLIHDIVPHIVKSLCTILITCTDTSGPSYEDEWQYERTVLAFASLVSLRRLKPNCGGKKIALVPMGQILKLVPDFLLPLLLRNGFRVERNVGVQVAHYIYIMESNTDEGQFSPYDGKRNITILSFEPVVSSITTALCSSRSARDNAKAEICNLLQSLGSLCFCALTETLLSGFSLSSPTLLDDMIFSSGVGVCAESTEELLARSKMLAALTESTVGRYTFEMLVTDANDMSSQRKHVDSLLNLLLYVCDSSRRAESIAGCRAVLATLPSLTTIDAVENNKKIIGIFTRVCDRLHREVMALKRMSFVEHESLVIQEITVLLSILHATVIDVRNELGGVLDCFDLCKDIIQTMIAEPPSFCLHLAIQCLVATIERLPYKAVESLVRDKGRMRLHLGTHVSHINGLSYGHFHLTDDFIELLLSELSNKRLLALREIEGSADPDRSLLRTNVSYHEELALELENMERFQVEEKDGIKGPLKGVWLCGDSLLVTCSIGSSKSRYRGWVELVARSPTFRKREMVRLISQFSVGNPDIPSMLWSSDTESNDETIEAPSSPGKSNELLSRYNSLINRFDALIPPLQQGDNISLASSANASRMISIESNALDADSFGPSTEDAGISIAGWLKEVLDSDSSVQIVQQALHKSLDLPQDLIQHGSMTEDPAESSSASYGRIISPVRKLKTGLQLDRAISVLDRTTPASTHKMAILYAGPTGIESGESDPEAHLLSVKHGSPAFLRFTEGLGKIVPTKQLRYFSGGLDVSEYESDGRNTRVWIGNEASSLPASKSIVVYHIAHLMPPGLNNRKRHVGNDNVLIIYLEKDPAVGVDIDLSEDQLKDSVVSGHFGFATIYVSVVSSREDLTRVTVPTVPMRDGLPEPLQKELQIFAGTDVIATRDAPAYVRGLAIRLDLACRSVHDNLAPPSNCNERFRMLREMKRYCHGTSDSVSKMRNDC
jgi:hypothetical protein